MIRARFYCNGEDPRPVSWPIQHPYWVTGYTGDEPEKAVIVAYADSQAQILALWPDAEEITYEPAEGYTFTDRFPRPEWLKP